MEFAAFVSVGWGDEKHRLDSSCGCLSLSKRVWSCPAPLMRAGQRLPAMTMNSAAADQCDVARIRLLTLARGLCASWDSTWRSSAC